MPSAEEKVAVALRIHAPCHTEQTEPWGCKQGHYDTLHITGIPDQPARCSECYTVYPCTTARALGA